MLAFEGPAGIGKTRLLGVLRERALAAGADVLDARAGVLEREFGFGVVRQLFEAVAAIAAAARGRALGVRRGRRAPTACSPCSSALFQYTATLATRRPLVLCIDDLQWSDTASLRFVAYLTRRDRRACRCWSATTIRTGEPDSDELLLGEIGQDPATVAVQPRPLSEDGTAGMVSALLGEGDDAFAAACQDVTAGNPLLLRQLLTALAAEHVVPDAVARRVGAGDRPARGVAHRAAAARAPARRPPPTSRARSRCSASSPAWRRSPQLAGVDEAAAAETIDALVRAEILRADEPLGFVHPLVRDAVYFELPAARRGLEHARAARLLDALGASPERIAAQLMLAPPRGDAWVVERLRAAAAIAIERGAPDAALAHLQRAQAEPPAPELRSALTLELGAAAEFVRGTAAAEALAQAHAGADRPAGARDGRGDARAHAAVHGEPGARRWRSSTRRGPSSRERGPRPRAAGDPDRRRVLRRRRPGAPRRARGVAGRAAQRRAGREDADRDHVAGGGRRSSASGTRPARWRSSRSTARRCRRSTAARSPCLPAAVLAMADPAQAEPEWQRIRALAGRRGSVLDAIGADLWGGLGRDLDGRPGAAPSSCSSGRWRARRCSAAPATRTWRTRRRSWRWRGSSAATSDAGVGGAARPPAISSGPSDGERFWMISHAELLLADGRFAEVLRDHRRAGGDAPAGDPPAVVAVALACVRGRPRGRAIRRLRHASRAKSWRSHAAAPRRGSWGGRCGSTAS